MTTDYGDRGREPVWKAGAMQMSQANKRRTTRAPIAFVYHAAVVPKLNVSVKQSITFGVASIRTKLIKQNSLLLCLIAASQRPQA